ncbi:A1S_2505 family phage non-structural protein [Brucella anthropi]|uniref:A1S_2505 family phage non-structural protein n=1 Tax=Brucella anthropi TaxID=529 RepID=UPI000F6828EC|nr:hypothetical protein [Brucella anthropi]RRY03794.1 hypothetical protein EGJ58_22080 [Brucella anthropi]
MNLDKLIFVFGSNLAGKHGAGAAKFAAKNRGAITGMGHGFYGQSYALPTKDRDIRTLPFGQVEYAVALFLAFAKNRPQLEFQVTRVGCGLAGFKDEQIAPLFINAPDNCWFDEAWKPWLGENRKYWGHQ